VFAEGVDVGTVPVIVVVVFEVGPTLVLIVIVVLVVPFMEGTGEPLGPAVVVELRNGVGEPLGLIVTFVDGVMVA